MRDLLTLGKATGLCGYDASYLELAMRKDCPVATVDKKLVAAAEKVGVTVFKP